MTAAAIISGDFSTFRHVQGRKVLQMIIEVPAEQAASVFSTFGYPGSGNPIPVAVARLVEQPATEEKRERTPFTGLPYAQQAAMRCNEHSFWFFIRERGSHCEGVEDAARFVRLHCMVESRKHIAKGTPAGKRWEALEAEYFAQSRGLR